ncbi:MAG TPA: thymidine kinase, partial [Chitinophagaceae bacterium]|nr:thymidine kinase [Chitinophagaceae bacterium]
MFIEPNLSGERRGWIEVICGSMFSGKTEELIRRIRRAELAKQKIEIFKPKIDTRYHQKNIISHQGSEIKSTPIA